MTMPSRVRTGIHIALAATTLAAFAQVSRHEFVRYDDDVIVFEQPVVRQGLTFEGIRLACTGTIEGDWGPLTTLSHMAACQAFGVEQPGAHHLINLILHTASVLLLFESIWRMTSQTWPSALTAALFAIHPLRVESVAWVAERKDVLSGLFFMFVLLAYTEYARQPTFGRYLLVSLWFVLGLMCKPMLVTLPCVLLLLDYWPLGRWRLRTTISQQAEGESPFPPQPPRRLLFEKLPWIALSLAACIVTLVAARAATPTLTHLSWGWRLIAAPIAYTMYLWKTLWPTNLAVLYPHPGLQVDANISAWFVPAAIAALGLLSMSTLAMIWAKRAPSLFVGWFWFVGMLVPVIGIYQTGIQAYADRFTYLPMIGVYLIVAFGAASAVRRRPQLRWLVVGVSLMWVATLSAITWHNVENWRNSRTLFEQALRATDNNVQIHYNLGQVLTNQNDLGGAAAQYLRLIALRPGDAMAHYNLGNVLWRQGKPLQAIDELRRAVQLDPHHALAHNNLGFALMQQGELHEAEQELRRSIATDPQEVLAHSNLGQLLLRTVRTAEAVSEYRQAVQLAPNSAAVHVDLGAALLKLGQWDEARSSFDKALKLQPDNARALENLSRLPNTKQSREIP